MKKYNVNYANLIVYMIPTIICLVVAIMFFGEAKAIADFRNDYATVKGSLSDWKTDYNEDDRLVYYGKYDYEVNGQNYSVWSKYGELKAGEIKKEVLVYYDERNPKNSRVDVDTKYIYRNIIMGVLFLIAACIIVYIDYRRIKKYRFMRESIFVK